MKKTIVIFLLSLFFVVGCGEKDRRPKLRVGVIAGPEMALMEVAKKVASEKYDLNVQIVEFTDYVTPNVALVEGSIDANMYQHEPYLNAMIQSRGYALKVIGKTYVYPMGIYSERQKAIQHTPLSAKVAIPNDPSNGARALLLLEKAGLIQLVKGRGVNATLKDVEANPKHLTFVELDAAQLARNLKDVDLAAINTNYAMVAGLSPSQDAIFKEDASSRYVNVLVARAGDDRQSLKNLASALNTKAVDDKANDLFKGEAIRVLPQRG